MGFSEVPFMMAFKKIFLVTDLMMVILWHKDDWEETMKKCESLPKVFS